MYIWRCPVVLQADRTHDVGPIDCWMRSHSLIIWSQFASPRPLVAATIHTERWHHNVPKTAQHPYLYSIFSRLTDICIVTHDSRPHALRRSSTISLHSLQSLGDSVTRHCNPLSPDPDRKAQLIKFQKYFSSFYNSYKKRQQLTNQIVTKHWRKI